MRYRSKEAVIENLQDAGCGEQTITDFLSCLKKGQSHRQLRLLGEHRAVLLNQLHEERRRLEHINLLSYRLQNDPITQADKSWQKELLKRTRQLYGAVRKKEKEIDCLDYLIFQIEQGNLDAYA